ncbi:uncharacterized protein M6B38_169645 [Iris pallida]|uniref:C2HC zinc finger plants domain-containing protein n=1 Tax=Iris pallida TaxID=29817 RepID=A0AAX6EUP0_IRIPA|nr:uncharacterized protein M6B38_169645 [Iris pallida]
MDESMTRSLLAMARQLIEEGKPSAALQAVMAAMKSQGGEQAVFQILQRARELYSNMQGNSAADELASLFEACSIAETQPLGHGQPQAPGGGIPPMPVPSLLNAVTDASVLAIGGRKQVMLDAFSDGSSFICLRCGGLVSNLRKDEHLAYWCSSND